MPVRKCGDCQLCCRLLAVREIDKATGARCKHQQHGKGCRIYPNRPRSCKLWTCRWALGQLPEGMRRPDRAHYAIDIMPDFITADRGTGPQNYLVIQIWADSLRPEFHLDTKLIAYLGEQWEHGILGIVRLDARRALAIIPPGFAGQEQGNWAVVSGTSTSQHTPEEIVNAMQDMAISPGEMAERLMAAVC
jgi:hypothetical protein